MDIDLELSNYDLNDLLKLFSLNSNFGTDELKQVKRTVVQIHPDKSGLDKKFFLFYCKAYRAVKNIYEYRNKRDNQLKNSNAKIEYLAESEDDAGKRYLIENLQKKNSEEFNKWFNETFEKINITDERRETGYGEWFQSNEDIDTTKASKNQIHEKITKRKEELSALAKVNTILGTSNTPGQGYNELDTSCPESYGSDIFSKLPFEDLKIAHTETVVPVGTNDYNKVLKFKNVESLRQHRNNQETNPMTENESKKYLDEQNKNQDDIGLNLAYKLTKQDEEAKEANTFWWNSLRSLK